MWFPSNQQMAAKELTLETGLFSERMFWKHFRSKHGTCIILWSLFDSFFKTLFNLLIVVPEKVGWKEEKSSFHCKLTCFQL